MAHDLLSLGDHGANVQVGAFVRKGFVFENGVVVDASVYDIRAVSEKAVGRAGRCFCAQGLCL
jgi:hypothetical protein